MAIWNYSLQESTENKRAGPLPHCPLGRTGALLPALGLGCVTFGRELGEDESFRILDHALEQGLSLFDTAESYGTSEEIIGRWLASRDFPKEVTICTKVSFDNSPEHIACAVRGSIERLGIDQIDLYLLHVWDERVPIGETMSALKEQIDAGNVKALGGSNFTAEQLLAANEAGAKLGVRLEAVQNIYNLAKASEQDAVFDLCRNEDISFIAFSPLGAGFLTGKYTASRDDLPADSRFAVKPAHCDIYFSERNFQVVERLREKAEKTGETMTHLASAWVTSSADVACTLVGARTTEHIDNAMRAYKEGISVSQREEMLAWGTH